MSDSMRRVEAALLAAGMSTEIVEFDASTKTSADAAAAIGCEVAQIAKSVILRAKQSERHVLVVTSGINRVDEKAVAALVGEKIGRADADFVREKTGYVIGGVSPVAHASEPITLIDEDLLGMAEIWAAAGTPNSVFKLTPEQLLALTAGQVAKVKEEKTA
ncbi:Cys-tRNA(Pro) deacylase, prolyl-tRNA editing enzyme YbaK/EbsC [Andreprevotia lacus DSM 23236]|jgi:prolyl-tRNA editing enzyme YbaK/EbsC (Cys-tRNA(Pro) deacylase)|uniref:Cys-tRNA(Pro) deacylase, prolyl-tRNA editing enzyme YbaK/EbsC n=1 Tax=Andreprevotia lacus DSM 23236 TaxID=1121001 RepID=A0A1W1X7H0_9NEIS|nr:YbaK/EbsC family protein [Andreprevotia lacus]SMC19885.1 Cys-tRNA(Pro) deacylase, prolyl-tRNA editing enzyme YbaK/EbsC [Andreprevotia lacus DSM 23236]